MSKKQAPTKTKLEGNGGSLAIGSSSALTLSDEEKSAIVQNLKEVVPNTEEEIYATLHECGLDPNKTFETLMTQDPFEEVKRRRDRKQAPKDPSDLRSRSTSANRGGRGSPSTDRGSSRPGHFRNSGGRGRGAPRDSSLSSRSGAGNHSSKGQFASKLGQSSGPGTGPPFHSTSGKAGAPPPNVPSASPPNFPSNSPSNYSNESSHNFPRDPTPPSFSGPPPNFPRYSAQSGWGSGATMAEKLKTTTAAAPPPTLPPHASFPIPSEPSEKPLQALIGGAGTVGSAVLNRATIRGLELPGPGLEWQSRAAQEESAVKKLEGLSLQELPSEAPVVMPAHIVGSNPIGSLQFGSFGQINADKVVDEAEPGHDREQHDEDREAAAAAESKAQEDSDAPVAPSVPSTVDTKPSLNDSGSHEDSSAASLPPVPSITAAAPASGQESSKAESGEDLQLASQAAAALQQKQQQQQQAAAAPAQSANPPPSQEQGQAHAQGPIQGSQGYPGSYPGVPQAQNYFGLVPQQLPPQQYNNHYPSAQGPGPQPQDMIQTAPGQLPHLAYSEQGGYYTQGLRPGAPDEATAAAGTKLGASAASQQTQGAISAAAQDPRAAPAASQSAQQQAVQEQVGVQPAAVSQDVKRGPPGTVPSQSQVHQGHSQVPVQVIQQPGGALHGFPPQAAAMPAPMYNYSPYGPQFMPYGGYMTYSYPPQGGAYQQSAHPQGVAGKIVGKGGVGAGYGGAAAYSAANSGYGTGSMSGAVGAGMGYDPEGAAGAHYKDTNAIYLQNQQQAQLRELATAASVPNTQYYSMNYPSQAGGYSAGYPSQQMGQQFLQQQQVSSQQHQHQQQAYQQQRQQQHPGSQQQQQQQQHGNWNHPGY